MGVYTFQFPSDQDINDSDAPDAIYPIAWLNSNLKHRYWSLVLFALESLGATFIKLGQWAGTRRDLFSAEFCDMFSCLHVRTMVHSWSTTKKRIRKAFGKRWREILVRIHKKPVGSGCIAQVHKAYMRADMIPDEALVDDIIEDADEEPEIDFADGLEIVCLGSRDDNQDDSSGDICDDSSLSSRVAPSGIKTESSETAESISEPRTTDGACFEYQEQLIPVAVKVLHPGVYHAVHRDLRILSGLVWFVEKLFPSLRWLSAQECMAEFTDLLLRQIDLRMEAECLEEFNENFAEHPNEGEPITNYLLQNSDKYVPEGLKEKLASFGVDALLQMIFVDNFVHGDLHPGNILVQNANDYVPQEENKLMLVDVGDTVILSVKPTVCPVRLILLDVGITASLSEKDMINFRNVFKAVVIGDGDTVAELMLRHAKSNECKDIEAFKKELGTIVVEARKNTITLGQLQVGKLLSDVFAVLSRHRVKMESSFASVLLAIFVLEGLGRSLDPEIDILEKAKPVLLG
ncbi:hypothetical protein LSH36_48g06022 [Paralvinella palmiformis]|uniref:ABC1 atypical kinase-like domain-containing protein n=1 Tax=Paralvinella palmiformis TaxID=53620 RepID=A0AAD9NEF3_9ANNE|nr:hypothetical protein LSH36_48g06022 [Paralvinella palmiformis]